MMKGVNERIDEGVLWWFGKVDRMGKERIAKKVCVGEWVGSCSVDRPWKRWIDTVKDCLRKRGLGVKQAWTMVQDRSEWQGFLRGSAWGIACGMNPRP